MKKVIAKLLIMLMITLTYGPYFNATSAIYASEDTETVLDRPTKLADVLGVCHMSAYYNFTDEDILNEGANQILDMGGRVIKVWFHPGVIGDRGCYAFNSNWPDLKNTSLVELAQIEYFKELFEKPFTTYIMNTYENPLVNWKNGLSEDEEKFIKKEFYDLAKYLLTTYKNTRKTFVISNWEGDGALNVKDIPEEKRATAYQGMADWLNARQEAITQAREEVGMNGVKVVGAAEFNYIPSQKEKDERKFEEMFGENITFGVDTVVPLTKMDLYSFSTWGTNTPGTEETLIEKLDYYASKAPDSELYGDKNIYIGEFGSREMISTPLREYPGGPGDGQMHVIREQLKHALNWGVVYAAYWQLYCNGILTEDRDSKERPKVTDNNLFQGLWLIRADGSKPPIYHYLNRILEEDSVVYNTDGETIYNPFAKGEDEITVEMNGKPIMFPDQPPVLQEGRVLVPMRKIFETFGAEIEWNAETSTVTATKNGKNIILTIDSNIAKLDDEEITLDVPAMIINGRTMVPVRFISESLEAEVGWDEATMTVLIKKEKEGGSDGIIETDTEFSDISNNIVTGNDNRLSDSIIDDMSDWSKMYSRSSGWKYRKEAETKEGTSGRIYRATVKSENVIYKLNKEITDFNIKAIFQEIYKDDFLTKLYKVYGSKDGENWEEISLDSEVNIRPAERSGFVFADLKPANKLKEGYIYLKIDALGIGAYYSNQIAEVKIN